jgi:hypothetical protein
VITKVVHGWHPSGRSGIARELLHGAGIAETGDGGGPRWVAVRHADDHIHIAVVLVRQDDCRRIWPRHDYTRLRAAAREIESRFRLTVTAPADGTAARAPSRAELENATRQGVMPARVELRMAVRRAAIAAHDVDSFVLVLGAAGYRVQVRRGPSGDALGYAVARRAMSSPQRRPVSMAVIRSALNRGGISARIAVNSSGVSVRVFFVTTFGSSMSAHGLKAISRSRTARANTECSITWYLAMDRGLSPWLPARAPTPGRSRA